VSAVPDSAVSDPGRRGASDAGQPEPEQPSGAAPAVQARPCTDPREWDAFVDGNGGHPLQSWGWGELKSRHRWSAERVLVTAGGAVLGGGSILYRPIPAGLGRLAYLPRGPVLAGGHTAGQAGGHAAERAGQAGQLERTVAEALAEHARRAGAIVLMIEPDAESYATGPGWRRSPTEILPARTLILDLRQDEDALMAAMAKKTRQYIRKSAAEALQIRPVETLAQLEECLRVYDQTAERARFGLHERSYYRDAFEQLGPEHRSVWASYQGERPVAFLWLGHTARTAFELYGGMDPEGQRLRANYALKWHAIRAMRAAGVQRYDFGGLINDGVTTFKKGFASHEDLLAGSWDRPLSWRYPLYARALPLARAAMRRLSRRGGEPERDAD